MKNNQNSPQIMSEVNKFIKKAINATHDEGEFISSIFLRSKPDGTNQVILKP